MTFEELISRDVEKELDNLYCSSSIYEHVGQLSFEFLSKLFKDHPKLDTTRSLEAVLLTNWEINDEVTTFIKNQNRERISRHHNRKFYEAIKKTYQE